MQTRQEEKFVNSNRHYSLRKLSVGLASVLIGISFLNGTKTTVKADTIANNNDEYAKAHENNENSESMQAALLKNTDVAEGDSVHMQSAKNVDTADIVAGTSSVQSGSAAQNSNISTKAGEVSKAGNFEVAGDISSAQNSVAKPQQNKLTNNGGTDSKENLGQNLTTSETTKQVPTTKSDADKSIAGSSSAQQVNNQLNNRVEGNSQAQPQNSLKLAKRMLTTNLIATPPTTNGGFDESTWGKLDVNNWQGQAENGVYQLTSYTGDPSHIIVPNEADFEQAGRSTNGLQVGIDSYTVNSLFSRDSQNNTIAFSKTNNQAVKAIGTDWSDAFLGATLSKFDGSSLDVSTVTDMSGMFESNQISDLTSLANWDISEVTGMTSMFAYNKVSDLTPLAHWNTSNVTGMSSMFRRNKVSDLTPLANWDTSQVTSMSDMFESNQISDLTPLANWDTSQVTSMSDMFESNQISDLTPLANWDTSQVTSTSDMFAYNKVSNLTPLANWKIGNVTDMSHMFESNQISDLTPLTNWKTGNVTDMSRIFADNKVSDLTSLANWNTSNVTDMSGMFDNNTISDLTPLANWNISKVTNMRGMLANNSISDLTPLANWKTSNVTYMSAMFGFNPDLIDLKPIANWNMSSVSFGKFGGPFQGDTKLDLTNINNTPLMQGFLKTPKALQGATFITNNADFVKAVVGQDLPTLTNTAKRTIVFNIPHATPETIVQIINYKALAPVQIGWSNSIGGGGWSGGAGSSTIIGGGGSSSGGFHYTLSGGGFSSGTGSSVVVGGGGNRNIIRNRMRMAFVRVGTPVQTGSDGPKIIKTYSAKDLKASDWQLDDSKPNDAVIVNGQIRFKPVQIPHINGYKPYIMKDPVKPAMFLVSFFAVPEQLQNKQSNNVQLPQKPVQPEQKQSEQKQSEQKQSEQTQPEQKQPEQKQPEQKPAQPKQKQPEQKQSEQKQPEQTQPEQTQPEQKPAQPIQTRPADDKQVDQAINHISYVLMHNDSTFDNVNNFEPAQDNSAPLEDVSDLTQKDDAAKIVNAAKPKKHIAKKRVVKRHKKHAKKYHLKRRSRKHTKRSRHAKKRLIKHRKSVSRKFRKSHLKHAKKA